MARFDHALTLNPPLGDPLMLMMRVTRECVWLGVVTIVSGVLACSGRGGDGVDAPPASGPADPTHLVPNQTGGAVDPGSAPGAAGTGANTGLPCDVQAILEDRCITCHSGTYPPPLLTYENLTAPAPSDPKKSLAAAALERMKSVTAPMPPPPAVGPDATEITTFEAWVNAGTPRAAACTSLPDGGAPAAPTANPYATPTVCTSGKTSTADEGTSMKPGMACNACHQREGGPNLRVAGTVYKTAHEPDNCVGAAPPPQLTVIITDARGRKISLPVNSAGNFSTRSKLSAPYRAEITDGTKTRAMAGSVTTGDCNSCHTEQGANGAPGRVMAP